ncbi:MAG: M1 family metallopeptidase [Bacteroidia bacterium]|nr:M1 family metallopeptidase [Bacteroidia bacterium]
MHFNRKFGFSTVAVLVLLFIITGCNNNTENPKTVNETDEHITTELAKDAHSFSNPNDVAVTHMHLDLAVDFEQRILHGSVRLDLDNKKDSKTLHLDTRQLHIEKIELDNGEETKYALANDVEYFGQDLAIEILPTTKYVTIYYKTDPAAEALQWLLPEQTSGGEHPFLFSQSQAILARTWVPCQDSPGVKFTYSARITTSPELIALMSAQNGTTKNENGVYEFTMDQPVSSYLLALTVGDLNFQSLGRNCGVYAEPNMVEKCAWEFTDMQSMIDSAEALYGKYAWGQYDVVVLPPSFPFGGMENPRLTFATPTIIAGDRSLVALIAHELAHSWSGNLVTNETWNDFWLNEGFTVYFEQRIMEKVFGTPYEEMETKLGMGGLKHTIARLTEEGNADDTHLYLELDGRNPDDGLTDIAYEKGRFFLQTIEKAVGREKFDAFLKQYFSENAFKPMNTARFEKYLDDHLLKGDTALINAIQPKAWIYGPGLPANAPVPQSIELDKVEEQIEAFMGGKKASELTTDNWTTHHWLYFLRGLKSKVDTEQLADLDDAFGFTTSGNSEILCDWFQHCIALEYKAAYPSMEKFLTSVGRRKFLTPLYEPLAETEDGLAWARNVYEKAKPGYHAVSKNTIEGILK